MKGAIVINRKLRRMGKKLLDGLVGIRRTKVDSLESTFRSHLSAKAVLFDRSYWVTLGDERKAGKKLVFLLSLF